jgi:predicted hydrolase (HD superfamily)
MNYYKITDIEFDFDYEDLTDDEQNEIIQETVSCLWTSPTEDDLADTITNNTGWCIKSLSYDIVQ